MRARVERTGLKGEAALRAHLASCGCRSVFSWHDGAGADYPPHQHGHDEVIAVVRGEIVFEIGGERHALGEGDVLHLPAGTVHTAEVTVAGGVDYLIGSR